MSGSEAVSSLPLLARPFRPCGTEAKPPLRARSPPEVHTPTSPLENGISEASSPYLLQHADNPVAWQQWSDEVFRTARELDRLVFLSIGYSTCHWCHVMAQESFEDDKVAAVLEEVNRAGGKRGVGDAKGIRAVWRGHAAGRSRHDLQLGVHVLPRVRGDQWTAPAPTVPGS